MDVVLNRLLTTQRKLKKLQEDISELCEQIEIIERLPGTLNVCQIDGWRSGLAARLRFSLTASKQESLSLIENDFLRLLQELNDFPSSKLIEDDLENARNFFTQILNVSANKTISRHTTIPEPTFVESQSIQRLINSAKCNS